MADLNVIAVSFAEPSKAYQALSDLKNAGAEGRVEVRGAAIVERDENGRLRVPESGDAVLGGATWGGGLVGLLIGVLGGPIGMLFGWVGGLLVGGAFDLRRADRGDSVLGEISRHVANGTTAVIAEVDEYAVEVVDNLMSALGGTVYRRSAGSILAELEAAEEAYEQAQKEANQVLREQQKAERKENMESRKAALKDKLGIS